MAPARCTVSANCRSIGVMQSIGRDTCGSAGATSEIVGPAGNAQQVALCFDDGTDQGHDGIVVDRRCGRKRIQRNAGDLHLIRHEPEDPWQFRHGRRRR